MMCIIMFDMKSVMEKIFRSFLFYSNLKYDKFREPYLAHAALNLLTDFYQYLIKILHFQSISIITTIANSLAPRFLKLVYLFLVFRCQ